MSAQRVELGLRENAAQFALLVAVNAFVGAMVGLERSTLPLIDREDFGIGSKAAVLSFIVAFGLAKALTNLGAGGLAARIGRRKLLIAGWLMALPVPLLIAAAPTWGWIVAANALLGINQGLAWSMTVVMKIDLVGPQRRGLALGLKEAAGYGGVALAAAASGWLAAEYAAQDVLVVAGAVIALVALAVSVLFVRDTAGHVALEQRRHHDTTETAPALRDAFSAGDVARSGAAVLLAGRLGQQPQRRPGVGPHPTVPRRSRGERVASAVRGTARRIATAIAPGAGAPDRVRELHIEDLRAQLLPAFRTDFLRGRARARRRPAGHIRRGDRRRRSI